MLPEYKIAHAKIKDTKAKTLMGEMVRDRVLVTGNIFIYRGDKKGLDKQDQDVLRYKLQFAEELLGYMGEERLAMLTAQLIKCLEHTG